ncbi:MAG: nucleotidyltransferase domain-containing protein [Cyclobacteriaceae bacterium]|nr:nucleotidyltransferase domain-containing protein [Cyclobacteriaceae bacterium]MCX7637962.1 nucleotidyltransferase domain-containing protein [Cyclobacteriaceae bacterium]MDW8331986.1 nucleotidyltransferase domain-containing protein [Cyclobacteriaceae bacterium]
MFTRQAVFDIVNRFLRALKADGFNPTRAVLFGSYVRGKAHRYSDIDLAVWDEKFSGCLPEDIELLHNAKRQVHPALEVHTFHASETEETNPFIKEILREGIMIEIPND